jgi:hypothetical protein
MKQKAVRENFREYMTAEVSVMLNDIGPEVKPGSTRFTMRALKWIEQNAADFRMKWDRGNNMVIEDTKPDGKNS